jgi:hypothetical protein
MNDRAVRAYLDEQAQKFDEDVREAIELAGGDITRALRATLIANTFLIEENERLKAMISAGFVRSKATKSN